MPEHLRALAVILLLATLVFALAKPAACAAAISAADFERRSNLWFALTAAAFLAHNFWLFVAVATAVILFAAARESNRLALFFFLLFAVPSVAVTIPGLGGINQLFALDYARLLSLTLLLPAAVRLLSRPAAAKGGTAGPDVLLAAYLLFALTRQLSVDTFTNTLRYGFYAGLDIVLPYYVASRSMRNLRDFRDTLMSFVVAAMLLAAIGAFEFAKKWLLYSALNDALGLVWGYGEYLTRETHLRALATTGQPIALGYVLAAAFGFYLYLYRATPGRFLWYLGLGLLLAGLVATVSRGPAVGAGIVLAAFAASDRKPFWSLLRLGLLASLIIPVVLVSPVGGTIVDHLPFIGKVDTESIVYRQRLLESSMEIIRQHPWLGSNEFLGQMEDMRQGEGIIDIVNTYLGILLTTGLVGLGLFASFFATVGLRLYRGLLALPAGDEELHRLGQALLATLAGVLVIIFTVSSITVIPIVYWSVAGLGLACARLLEDRRSRQSEAAAAAAGAAGAKA